MLYLDYIVITGLSYHLLLAPNCMVIVVTFTFKKDIIIHNHLPTFHYQKQSQKVHQLSTWGVVRVTTWNGWFVGVSWPNPYAKRFCASSWCTTICLGLRTPTGQGRRNRSLRRRENRSARSGERQNDGASRSCKCETTVMSGSFVCWWIFVKGVMNIHWTCPMISGRNFEWHKVVSFSWTNLPHE